MRDFEDDLLRSTVNAQVLLFAVKQAIFCQRCGGLLDVRAAVLIHSRNTGTKVLCAQCWESTKDGILASEPGLEVMDGRACTL